MIRTIQRRLIIPRGDTGTFTIPTLQIKNTEAPKVAVFSIFNMKERIFQKEVNVIGDNIQFVFEHEDTVDLPIGIYNWDVKIYVNPKRENNKLVDGDEVHSYYAAFDLPVCEIARAPIHERG